MAGLLLTEGSHIVEFLISFNMEPCFPITNPGFLASITTVLLWLSKIIFETSASSGTTSRIVFSVSSVEANNLESALNSILFFIFPTISFIFDSPFLKNSLSVV